MPKKAYIGDGVYAQFTECGELILTTENGIETTNTIYFDPDTLVSLISILEDAESRC